MNRRSPSLTKSLFKSRAFLRRPSKRAAALAIALASLCLNQDAGAAARTWVGSTSTDWATLNGFNVVPVTGDSLTFGADGTAGTSAGHVLTNTLTTSAFNIAGITFSASAPAYTMTGNTFNLTFGITNSSSNLQTFSNTGGLTNSVASTFTVGGATAGISITTGLTDTFNANQTTTVNGTGGTLTLGSFTLNSGAASVTDTINGTGIVTVSGAVTNGGAGTNGLSYTGSSTLTLNGNDTYTGLTTLNSATGTLVLAGNNSGAGGVTLTAGTLDVNNNNALGAVGGTLTITAGTIDSTVAGISNAIANPIAINGNFTFGGTNNLNLGSGAVTGSFTRTVTLNGTSKTLTLGGTFGNNNDAANTLTVNGSGNTLSLGGIALDNAGTTARTQTLAGSGNVTVTGAVVNGSSTAGQALTYAGTGTLTLSATGNSYTGGTTLTSGNLSLTGTLTGSGNNITVNGGAFSESGTGVIGTTAGTLTTTGGTTTLSGLNTYTGVTNVNGGTLNLDFSQATVQASANNIIKTGNTVNLGGGALVLKGGGTGTNSQTFGTTALTANTASTITTNVNGGTALNLALGGITRNSSTVDITFNTGTGAVTTTATGGSGGLLGENVTNVAFATASGGTTWVAKTGVTPFTLAPLADASYSTTYAIGNNVEVASGDSQSGVTVNTLRFKAASDALTLAGVNIVNTGGILVTSAGTGSSITGGTITSSTLAAEVVIHDYGSLNEGAVIANANAGATATKLTLAGPGTTTLSAANTFTGQATVLGGTLKLANQLALQNSTLQIDAGPSLVFDSSVTGNAFTLGGLQGAGNIALVNNNAATPIALTVGGNNASTTYSGVLSGAGSLTKNGSGTLNLNSNQAYTGGLTINNGAVAPNNGIVGLGSTGTLTLGQAGSGNGVSYTTAASFNNPITVNPGLVGSPGAASRTFNQNSGSPINFGGAINLVGGATLTVNKDKNTWTFTGGVTGTGNILLQQTAADGGSYVFSTNPVNMVGTFTNSPLAGNNDTISSVVGSNVTGVIQNSPATLILSNSNTFFGDTTITSGTVNLQNALSAQNSVVVTNSAAGLLTFGTPVAHQATATLGGLQGNGNVILNDQFASTPSAVALTIGNSNAANGSVANPNTQNPTYAGVLSNTTGAASVTKVGTNTQTFTGANTYTGATAVNAGTLLINGNDSAATGAVTVNNTGTLLGGTGTIGGATTITGGSITGATSGTVGALTLSSTLALGSAGTYLVDIGAGAGNNDRLAIGSTLSITAGATINFNTLSTLDQPLYDLANYISETGTFTATNLPSGYALQYNAGELDLVTAVPEPSTWLGAFLAVGALGYHLRKRMSDLIKGVRAA